MLHEHYLELIDDTARLVAEIEHEGDPKVAETVATLLRHVDLVHREGLLRLVEALRANGAGPLLDRIIEEDPVVRIVLGLYALADLGLPPDEDEAVAGPGPAPAGTPPPPSFFPLEQLRVRRAEVPGTSETAPGGEDGER